MKVIALEQRSPAWHDWRAGKDLPDGKPRITATMAAILSGLSPFSTPYRLWLELTKRAQPQPPNPAMLRGARREDEALTLFNQKLQLVCAPACIEHDSLPWVAASLDGLDPLDGVLAEIKWPGRDDHDLAAQGIVPEKYAPQLAWQWFAAGGEAKRQFYVSAYELDDKRVDLQVVEVFRRPLEENRLLVLAQDFRERCLIRDESPTGSAWDRAAADFIAAKQVSDAADAALAEVKKKLEALLGDRPSCEGAGVLVARLDGRDTTPWKEIAIRLAEAGQQQALLTSLTRELTKPGTPSLRVTLSPATMPTGAAPTKVEVEVEPAPLTDEQLHEEPTTQW